MKPRRPVPAATGTGCSFPLGLDLIQFVRAARVKFPTAAQTTSTPIHAVFEPVWCSVSASPTSTGFSDLFSACKNWMGKSIKADSKSGCV